MVHGGRLCLCGATSRTRENSSETDKIIFLTIKMFANRYIYCWVEKEAEVLCLRTE
jgi:hypothetical protein